VGVVTYTAGVRGGSEVMIKVTLVILFMSAVLFVVVVTAPAVAAIARMLYKVAETQLKHAWNILRNY
jgi:hypothetical protein